MITQRLAAVRQADLVLVLDRGRIVEQGPPDQLMAKQGLFYRMAVAQDPARG
jgi:ATP-binding cassette subfamily B protein